MLSIHTFSFLFVHNALAHDNYMGCHRQTTSKMQWNCSLVSPEFFSVRKTNIQLIPSGCKLCSKVMHGLYSSSQRYHSILLV